jgi:hypothetical protein
LDEIGATDSKPHERGLEPGVVQQGDLNGFIGGQTFAQERLHALPNCGIILGTIERGRSRGVFNVLTGAVEVHARIDGCASAEREYADKAAYGSKEPEDLLLFHHDQSKDSGSGWPSTAQHGW